MTWCWLTHVQGVTASVPRTNHRHKQLTMSLISTVKDSQSQASHKPDASLHHLRSVETDLQKIRHWSMCNVSMMRCNNLGFSFFTASDQFSGVLMLGPTWSKVWAPSVGVGGSVCSQLRSSCGSSFTHTWSTVSGTYSLPCSIEQSVPGNRDCKFRKGSCYNCP